MSKKLILAVALSLVLASGSLYSASAQCCFNLNPCGWSFPSFFGCCCGQKVAERRDMDVTPQPQIAPQYDQDMPHTYKQDRG